MNEHLRIDLFFILPDDQGYPREFFELNLNEFSEKVFRCSIFSNEIFLPFGLANLTEINDNLCKMEEDKTLYNFVASVPK